MYCEIKSKEVDIYPSKSARNPRNGNDVKWFECSGMYVDIRGTKAYRGCDKKHDEKCLLKNYK